MTAVAFDTLKLARALRERGKLTPEQAEGVADSLSEVFREEIATKTDIGDVRTDIARIKADLEIKLADTKAGLEAKLADIRADLLKWVIGAIGFQTVVIIGALLALLKSAGH